MLLDQLLSTKFQLSSVPAVDQLPDTELTRHLKQYLLSCRVDNKSPKTLIAYGVFVGYFIKFLAGAGVKPKLQEVSPDHIRYFILTLQERKLTPETINAYYRALHTFFNWLEGESYLSTKENPFNSKNLRAPKVPKKHVQGFPDDVVERIIRVCQADGSFAGMRNLAIVLIIFDSGVRRSELAGMQLADLFIDQGLIRVMGKGSKERIVALGETAQKTLLRYLMKRRDNIPALWVNEERNAPLQDWGISSAIKRIAERAGIPNTIKRGAHTYRHTAATNYLKNGGNLKCLQEMLGHEKISTTEKYLDALGPEFMIKDHKTASPVDKWLGKKR